MKRLCEVPGLDFDTLCNSMCMMVRDCIKLRMVLSLLCNKRETALR